MRSDGIEARTAAGRAEIAHLARKRRSHPALELVGSEPQRRSRSRQHVDRGTSSWLRAVGRAPVHAPRQRDAQLVGDRGQDVDRLHRAGRDAAAALPWRLDEERHGRDVLDVRRRDRARVSLAGAKRDTVIGGDDHQRAVPQPGLAQPVDQPAEQPIGEAELQQVPLVSLEHEERVLRRLRAGEPGGAASAAAIAVAVGEVLPGHVRQEHVLEVQRRRRRGPDRAHPGFEARRASAAAQQLEHRGTPASPPWKSPQPSVIEGRMSSSVAGRTRWA